jgi:hypothetical protein
MCTGYRPLSSGIIMVLPLQGGGELPAPLLARPVSVLP